MGNNSATTKKEGGGLPSVSSHRYLRSRANLGDFKGKHNYKTAEELGRQILFEYPFLKSMLSQAETVMSEGGSVIVVTDYCSPDQAIIWVSDGFELLTLYSREDVVGTNCRFLQGPDTSPDDVASIRTAIRAGEEIQIVLLNYRKDGTAFWNNLRLLPVHGPGKIAGTIFNYVGFLANIGEFHQLAKGSFFEWSSPEVDVWLRRQKYGIHARTLRAEGVDGGMLANMDMDTLRKTLFPGHKDSFMHCLISADTEAIYSLVCKQKKAALSYERQNISSRELPGPPTPSSSSDLSLGGDSEEYQREKSERSMDSHMKRGSWVFSEDSGVGENNLASKTASDESGLQPMVPRLGLPPFLQQQEKRTVAIKYIFQDREAVVVLVSLWLPFVDFQQKIAIACGVPGWQLDMIWRARLLNARGPEEVVSPRSPTSTSRPVLLQGSPQSTLTATKTVVVQTEFDWQDLLARAKGTLLMYCSKPITIDKVRSELDEVPGIP